MSEFIANYTWFIAIQCCVYHKLVIDLIPFTFPSITISFITIYYNDNYIAIYYHLLQNI